VFHDVGWIQWAQIEEGRFSKVLLDGKTHAAFPPHPCAKKSKIPSFFIQCILEHQQHNHHADEERAEGHHRSGTSHGEAIAILDVFSGHHNGDGAGEDFNIGIDDGDNLGEVVALRDGR
jgi:hypothetical protein